MFVSLHIHKALDIEPGIWAFIHTINSSKSYYVLGKVITMGIIV